MRIRSYAKDWHGVIARNAYGVEQIVAIYRTRREALSHVIQATP